VLHVVQRRNPGLEIILAPCRVQGEGAAQEIAGAIRLLNEFAAGAHQSDRSVGPTDASIQRFNDSTNLDLILLTRGGGSLEDLWAFNEEAVARAIFESVLPVVSAIGHEIDFTISDFVADVRAATPSAAAEIITEGMFASREFVADAAGRMRRWVGQQLGDKISGLAQANERLARLHPRRRFNEGMQRLDDLLAGLLRRAGQGTREHRVALRNLSDRLSRVRPVQLLKQRRELLERQIRRLQEQSRHRLVGQQDDFESLQARLRLLGPEQVLSRGYSITTDAGTGRVVRDATEVANGQRLKTRLKTGEVLSRVEDGP